jgi:hypothetical protein
MQWTKSGNPYDEAGPGFRYAHPGYNTVMPGLVPGIHVFLAR